MVIYAHLCGAMQGPVPVKFERLDLYRIFVHEFSTVADMLCEEHKHHDAEEIYRILLSHCQSFLGETHFISREIENRHCAVDTALFDNARRKSPDEHVKRQKELREYMERVIVCAGLDVDLNGEDALQEYCNMLCDSGFVDEASVNKAVHSGELKSRLQARLPLSIIAAIETDTGLQALSKQFRNLKAEWNQSTKAIRNTERFERALQSVQLQIDATCAGNVHREKLPPIPQMHTMGNKREDQELERTNSSSTLLSPTTAPRPYEERHSLTYEGLTRPANGPLSPAQEFVAQI